MSKTATRSRAKKRSPRSLLFRVLRVSLIVLAVLVGLAFCAVLAYVTLSPQHGAQGEVTENTSPGASIKLYLDRPEVRSAVLEIGGNLMLLAPLGVLLPMIFRRLCGAVRVLVCCGLISLAIETIQGTLISGRAFDIDDVILNTLGAVGAYVLLGRRLSRLTHPDKKPG